MKRVGSNLTYANVISTLCLFLLLGGGAAYAASHLGRNSVGTKQLKKNAVTGAKVKDRSLTGQDIDLRSLGTVPTAAKAGFAASAGTAQNAASAGTAATATTASNGATEIDWEGPAVKDRPSNIICMLAS